MQCPRCGVNDSGSGTCPDCGMMLEYFRCRIYSSISRFDTGHTVGKDLAIVEKLGQGATGITYKVQDFNSGDVYALKFVTVDDLYDEDNVRKFIKRLARVRTLEHPGIVHIRDVRETEYGYVAVLMEFIEGRNLMKVLGGQTRFDMDEAFRISREIGDAVAQAHGNGVLHRNLRPTNVILGGGDQVKVIDFAMPPARPINPRSPVAPYIPPEILQGGAGSDQRSDIYSLGKILYQLLTGLSPARIVLDKVPGNLRSILQKSLADTPEGRYEHIDEMLHDLDAGLSPEAEEVEVESSGSSPSKRIYIPDEESQIRVVRRSPQKVKVPAGDGGTTPMPRMVTPPPARISGGARGAPPPEEPVEEVVEEAMDDSESAQAASVEGRGALLLNGHKGYIHTVAISPDGRRVASGASDSSIRIWHLERGGASDVLSGHRGYVYALGFSSDARRLISVGMDGNIRQWNLDNPQDVNVATAHSDRIFALALDSARMRAFSAGMDGKIKIWDDATLAADGELPGHAERIYTLAVSRDGAWLASGSMDKTVKVWNLQARKEVATLKGHADRIYAVAISTDGRRIYTGSMDETIRIWNRETAKEVAVLKGHAGHVYCLVPTPDGRYLVSGSMDKTLRVWDLSSNKEVKNITGHEGTVSTMAISADGETLVSGSYDSVLRVWKFRALLNS